VDALTRREEVTLMLAKTTEVNLLYDFYSSLLTEKQRMMLELYYHEDWSLSEIAEQQAVSRQAVFEVVKRAEAILTELEAKLHLLRKYLQRQKLAQEVLQQLESMPEVRTRLEPLLAKMIDVDEGEA
jgi:uncharacterized protein